MSGSAVWRYIRVDQTKKSERATCQHNNGPSQLAPCVPQACIVAGAAGVAGLGGDLKRGEGMKAYCRQPEPSTLYVISVYPPPPPFLFETVPIDLGDKGSGKEILSINSQNRRP